MLQFCTFAGWPRTRYSSHRIEFIDASEYFRISPKQEAAMQTLPNTFLDKPYQEYDRFTMKPTVSIKLGEYSGEKLQEPQSTYFQSLILQSEPTFRSKIHPRSLRNSLRHHKHRMNSSYAIFFIKYQRVPQNRFRRPLVRRHKLPIRRRLCSSRVKMPFVLRGTKSRQHVAGVVGVGSTCCC